MNLQAENLGLSIWGENGRARGWQNECHRPSANSDVNTPRSASYWPKAKTYILGWMWWIGNGRQMSYNWTKLDFWIIVSQMWHLYFHLLLYKCYKNGQFWTNLKTNLLLLFDRRISMLRKRGLQISSGCSILLIFTFYQVLKIMYFSTG